MFSTHGTIMLNDFFCILIFFPDDEIKLRNVHFSPNAKCGKHIRMPVFGYAVTENVIWSTIMRPSNRSMKIDVWRKLPQFPT